MDFLTMIVILLVILVIISIALFVNRFKKDQSYTFLTRNQNVGKEENDDNEHFSNLFNFSPLKLDAKKLCPKLSNVEDKEAFYTELKDEFGIYVDMVALYAIISKDNYRKNYLKYLEEYTKLYNIETTEDDLSKFKSFTPTLLEKLDGEKLFYLGVMTYNGIGCDADKNLAFGYIRSAYCLNNAKASDLMLQFETAFNWEDLSISYSVLNPDDNNTNWNTRVYVWSSLLAAKEQNDDGMKQFSKFILEDYSTDHFTANEFAFDFALKCSEMLAKSDSSLWLKLGKMLLNDEFEATKYHSNAKKYLQNATTYGSAKDKAEAKSILTEI